MDQPRLQAAMTRARQKNKLAALAAEEKFTLIKV